MHQHALTCRRCHTECSGVLDDLEHSPCWTTTSF